MRKYLIIILSLFIMNTCLKAQPHVTRIGRWGEGYCESIFKRSGYTFVGNGAYLEVYKMVNNEYQKLHEILMPATVRDLWVRSDLTYIYSACGRKGLQIVSFDPGVEEFIRITGSIDTEGFSNGLIQFGSFVYIADGSNGMQIVDVGNPFNPIPRGKYPTAASAHEIWVANDSTALVAADSAGLYAIKITDPYYPSLIDLIGFQSIFPGFSARAYSVIKVDTVAYVSTGHGGMFTVDMRNPSNMQILGRWTDTVPVDVRHTWISGTSAYLACGEDGFYGPIDVSNPVSPGPLPFLPLDTEGVTLDIVVSQDTAYICDGSNGQLMLNVNINNPPTLLDSIDSADKSYDVTISGNYVYTATGKTGLKVFNFNFETNRPDSLHLNVVGTYDTPGEARGIAKQGNFAYVADGSQGLLGLDASDPNDLSFHGQYTFPGDTCYRVDVPAGSKAYAACGAAGYRIINISGTYFQLGIEDTPGDCRDIKVQNDTAFVADMTGGVRIYNVFNPVNTILLQSYTINMEAWAVDVSGSQVFVANGDYGILIWTPSTGSVYRIETEGKCTDIDVKEKTIYATVVNHGLRIYDFSLPGQYPLAGYYNTGEYPYSIMVDDNSGKLCVADGKDGLYILKSTITPDIAISPRVLNFGAVPTDYSRPLIVWVYNTGSTELKINRIIPNKRPLQIHLEKLF